MLLERVRHTKKDWHLLLSNVVKQYKNTIHGSTKLKPVDARQDKKAVEVKINLMLRSTFKTKYKDININYFVRIWNIEGNI